jgi:hypothetical protein
MKLKVAEEREKSRAGMRLQRWQAEGYPIGLPISVRVGAHHGRLQAGDHVISRLSKIQLNPSLNPSLQGLPSLHSQPRHLSTVLSPPRFNPTCGKR